MVRFRRAWRGFARFAFAAEAERPMIRHWVWPGAGGSGVSVVLCGLVAAGGGLFFGGADGPLGQSLTGLAGGLALLAALWRLPVAPPLPRGALWPLFWAGAALVWLVVVALVRLYRPEGTALPVTPDFFLPRFLGLLGGLCLLLTGFMIGRNARLRRFAEQGLVLLIVVHLLVGIALWAGGGGLVDAASLQWDGRFAGLIGNANVTAGICAAGGLLALSLWLAHEGPALRGSGPFYALSILAMLYGLGLTGGRLPALAMMAGVCALIGRQWLVRGVPPFGLRPVHWWGLLGGIAALLLFAGGVGQRAVRIGPDSYARYFYWQEYVRMGAHAPWTGFGPGAFTTARLYYFGEAHLLPSALVIHSPHSLPLQLWLTGGVPYVAAIVLAGGGIALRLVRTLRAAPDEGLQAGRIAALASMLLCAQADILLDMPVGVGIFLFVAGLAWGQACCAASPAQREGGRPFSGRETGEFRLR